MCYLQNRPDRRRLWSSFTLQLLVPSYRLSTVVRRSFPVAASMFWNTMPDDIQSAPSASAFRRLRKTFLFQHSFPDVILYTPVGPVLRFRGLRNIFGITAPAVWNSLPPVMKSSATIPVPLSRHIGKPKCSLNFKCNSDYSVQNDDSLRGYCTIIEESESGIRK